MRERAVPAEPSVATTALGLIVLLSLFGTITAVAVKRSSAAVRPLAAPSLQNRDVLYVDLDADDLPDSVVADSGPPAAGISWRLMLLIELSSGRTIRHRASWDSAVGLFGATDMNRDRRPEIWIDLGGNTAFTAGLITFDQDHSVLEIEPGPESFGVFTYYGKGPNLTLGLECTDLDGDGKAEIVETEQQAAITGDPIYEDAPEHWRYLAYRFDGRSVALLREERGRSLETRPRPPHWSSAFGCLGLT